MSKTGSQILDHTGFFPPHSTTNRETFTLLFIKIYDLNRSIKLKKKRSRTKKVFFIDESTT